MAQDATIGRVGLATSAGGDGLELNVSSWEQKGDQARVIGVIRKQTSVANLKALRDQLQGYGPDNTDEPVVPVTLAKDSSRDGFYEVASIDVSTEITDKLGSAAASGPNLAYKWEADLVRVPGWKAPMFEVLTLGADRSTAHAITEWSWVGAPSSTTAFGEVFTSRVASPVSTTKTGAETAVLWSAPTGSKTALYSDTFLYGALPANFYTAAARVEVSIDGETTWQTVVGRQSPITRTQGDGAQPPTHSIRISNGLVRMLVAEGMLRLEVYDSGAAAWEAKRFQLTGAGSTMTALTLISVPVTILRNDPCAATIRLWFGSLGGAGVAVGYCDLTVRRGSWVVEGYANAMDANEALGIRCNTDEAGTSVTGGIDATSADASGNKYQLRSPSAITAETTKGGIYLTSAAQTFPFAVATDKFTGDNTTSPSTSGLYFAAMNHRQRIVAR